MLYKEQARYPKGQYLPITKNFWSHKLLFIKNLGGGQKIANGFNGRR
jgi:hypothetical protein